MNLGVDAMKRIGAVSYQLTIMPDSTCKSTFYMEFSGKGQDLKHDVPEHVPEAAEEDAVFTYEARNKNKKKPAPRSTAKQSKVSMVMKPKEAEVIDTPTPAPRGAKAAVPLKKVDKNALSARSDGGGGRDARSSGGSGSSSSTSSRTATPPRGRDSSGDDTLSEAMDTEMKDTTAVDRERVKNDCQRFERELEWQQGTDLELYMQGDIDEEEWERRSEARRERRRRAGLPPDPPRPEPERRGPGGERLVVVSFK